MKIPNEIKIFGNTYKIIQVEDEFKWGHRGVMCFPEGQIVLNKSRKDIVTTLWHEMLHLITTEAGYDSLCENEGFIRAFGQLLTDVILQMEKKNFKFHENDLIDIAGMVHFITYKKFESEFIHGETDYYKQLITINDELNDQWKLFVLIHEFLHLILDYIGEHTLSRDEVFIDRMTSFIHEILVKNFIEENHDK